MVLSLVYGREGSASLVYIKEIMYRSEKSMHRSLDQLT